MGYPKFIAQKYSTEIAEMKKIINNHNNINGTYNLAMNIYKIILLLSESPMILFTHKKLLFTSLWRVVAGIRDCGTKMYDNYILTKLTEALDLLLHGYKLSDQECDTICNTHLLPENTTIEKFIKKARMEYVAYYMYKKILPYWKDELTPECIEYITSEIEKNIKKTNEFIAKEDILNTVYFVDPRPHNWREQLTDAGIPADD